MAVVIGYPEYAQEMSVMTGLRWRQQGRKNILFEGDLSEVKKYCIHFAKYQRSVMCIPND